VTGHEDPTKKSSNIAWDKLATAVGTLVFYMGIKNIGNIVGKLIQNGRDPETPVAVIRWASTSQQKSVVGTLNTIAEIVRKEDIRPPAVIVVGDVVRLRDTINWFEKQPLFGKTIMVTRTREQASDLVYRLENLGAECVEFSTIALEPPDTWDELDQAVERIEKFNWILFTSINAIRYFFKRLFELKLDARALKGTRIAVVGTATAECLREYGLTADLLPEVFTGKGLAEALIQKGVAGQEFLIPRALKAGEDLPEMLRQAGGEVFVAPVYQNVMPSGKEEELRDLLKNGIDLVTFTSSSTCSNFLFMLNAQDPHKLKELLAGTKIASIGPITSKTIRDSGLEVDIQPESYTIPALVDSVQKYFAG
jgi:uroporphyrinogen III methyltransferase/synthase